MCQLILLEEIIFTYHFIYFFGLGFCRLFNRKKHLGNKDISQRQFAIQCLL